MSPPPPPLEIQVLLSVPELSSNQVLVYLSPDSSRLQIKPTPKYILLESWVLAFNTRRISEDEGSEVALSTVYKHGIPLFRSLYSLLRILPTWKLCKRLRRRGAGNGNLNIQLRVRTQALGDSGLILGFGLSSSHFTPSDDLILYHQMRRQQQAPLLFPARSTCSRLCPTPWVRFRCLQPI